MTNLGRALCLGIGIVAACDGTGSPILVAGVDLGTYERPDYGPPPPRPDLGPPDLGRPPDLGPPSNVQLSFDPTNFGSTLAGHPVYTGGNLSDSFLISLNTDTGEVYTSRPLEVPFEVVSQPGGPDLGVFFFSDLVVPNSTTCSVLIRGSRPLVIVASGNITVSGLLDAVGGYAPAGGSYVVVHGNGPGGGGAWSGLRNGGGEGGAYCTQGGLGAGQTAHEGFAYGNTALSPLEGGSSGGVPANSFGGSQSGGGGGAIQLIAGGSITIAARGGLRARGGSGAGLDQGPGGGSGGAILLEAPSVIVNGALIADGGGGGSFISGAGAHDGIAAVDGAYSGSTAYGGGGGGSGRIRINTESGMTDVAIDAHISPPGGSSCYSLGTLLPVTASAGPTCPATPTAPGPCDLCLDRACCAELTACAGSALCSVCRTSATPGPGCALDPVTSSYRACVASRCPTACP